MYAMLLLPVALVFIVYPLMIYIWRNDQIRGREASRWDDPWGPVVITVLLIFALCIQFGLKVRTTISLFKLNCYCLFHLLICAGNHFCTGWVIVKCEHLMEGCTNGRLWRRVAHIRESVYWYKVTV